VLHPDMMKSAAFKVAAKVHVFHGSSNPLKKLTSTGLPPLKGKTREGFQFAAHRAQRKALENPTVTRGIIDTAKGWRPRMNYQRGWIEPEEVDMMLGLLKSPSKAERGEAWRFLNTFADGWENPTRGEAVKLLGKAKRVRPRDLVRGSFKHLQDKNPYGV